MNLKVGSTLAQYEIRAPLGEGGMGEVYRAEDTKLGREVAIKVLPQAFTDDPERFARFEREARIEIARVLADPEDAREEVLPTGQGPAAKGVRRFVPWLAAAALGLAGLWFGSSFTKAPEGQVGHSSIKLPEGVRLAAVHR